MHIHMHKHWRSFIWGEKRGGGEGKKIETQKFREKFVPGDFQKHLNFFAGLVSSIFLHNQKALFCSAHQYMFKRHGGNRGRYGPCVTFFGCSSRQVSLLEETLVFIPQGILGNAQGHANPSEAEGERDAD